MVDILTKTDFDKTVKASKTPVVVDFYADWCGPCKMMGPVFEELSKDMGKKVKFVKVNVDNEHELANQFGVRSIPTLVILNNGEEVDRMMGFLPKDQLKSQINEMLASVK